MSVNEEEDIFKETESRLAEDEEEDEEEEAEELNGFNEEPDEDIEVEDEDDDNDNDDNDEDEEDDEEEDEDDLSGNTQTDKGDTALPEEREDPTLKLSESESTQKKYYETLYQKSKLADAFEINPIVAIPYSGGINAIALPKLSKWFFTGGEDGFIRRYDFFGSIDGDVQLTAAQKHSIVDSVSNAGSLLGYWENEIPVKRSSITKDSYEPALSPVFSLAVHDKCLWILSGLSNGGINLQSIRHNEGTIIHHFKGHKETASVLKLNQAQNKVLSGSWDKTIRRWDLDTGETTESFDECTGQITSIELRPSGGLSLDNVQGLPNQDDDDDMGSLFGDDDDDDDEVDGTRPSKTTTTDNNDARAINQGHPKNYDTQGLDENVFLSASIDGVLNVWDSRINRSVIKFKVPKGTPPWCVSACWSKDGDFIYAGRRNSTVEEFSIKMPYSSGESRVSKTLKFPHVSGAVTVVRPLPNDRHILCGSHDNIRIYDLKLYNESHKKTPFLIVPGHHGGVLSDVIFDQTYRYMISASGNRGWQGTSTETAFIYDVSLS